MRKYTSPDYAKKSEAFKCGAVQAQKDYSKSLFIEHCIEAYGDLTALKHYNPNYMDYLKVYDKEIWKEAEKVNHASYERVKRLKDRVKYIIENYPTTFITLTFTQDCLERTTPGSRKQLVVRWLKSHGVPYVANIDFGKENEREHYHAVIGSQSLDYKSWHRNGALKGKKVVKKTNLEKDGDIKLAKYISKLANHAIKETCKRNALIYSRD